MQQTFWNNDINYWFEKLNSSDNGLTDDIAANILKQTVSNNKKQSGLIKDIKLFINQLKSPLVILLIVAVILSALLGQASDAIIISFIILSTSILSFLQERNACKVVEKLQSLIAHKCTVIRNGAEKEILSSQIVAGDILALKAGDIVPADCLLIEARDLQANEASLTGESFPILKSTGTLPAETPLAKRKNCLWEGSNIVSGTGKAIVIQTGSDTVFGAISRSAETVTETAFEKGIKQFGYFLMKVTIVLSVFILGVNLLFHRPVIDSLLFALALAVGMAPELLPAINTIAMSAGAKRMLAKKVIVKKLPSIQNFGEVNLLCTDKTGTITEGVITVEGIYDYTGNKSDFAEQMAYYNASMESGYANPIDDALKQLKSSDIPPCQKIDEIPYDFTRKRLSIAIHLNNRNTLISKGAVKNILDICTNVRTGQETTEPIANYIDAIQKQYTVYGINGLRVIGLCYKDINTDRVTVNDEKEMTFAGFITLQDPVKPGITDTINELAKLQVGLKIITGDNKNVATNIAKSIGIKEPVIISSDELESMEDDVLAQKAASTHIFAEVEPHQKEKIITLLRKTYTVAYIGDGINDVGAINAADTGISVNNAVDIAKEAADFVLIEKDLMVLCDGIKEGRKTFANTLKYIFINTGATFGNMFSVSVASLILPFLPMLPKQILLTNFLTDFPYLAVASDNVDDEQIARPGKWDMGLIRKYMVYFGIHSSLFDIITFLTLLYFIKAKEGVFQTGWFIESILTELFILFIIRTRKSFIKSAPGKYLFILSILALILTITLPYSPLSSKLGLVPLSLPVIASMIGIVVIYILTADVLKIWFFKKYTS
ncbi:MAG: magnesium-translocating P-type ATPase [Bacteroidetes bacterium]|nr:magnesium-translocating P-type ATPase [Bacteroidota bacterium]